MKKHPTKVDELKKKVVQSMMMEAYSNDKNKIVGSQQFQPKSKGRDNGHKTRGGQSDNRRNNQKRDYKDLDDPKEVNVKVTNSRVQINYDDI